MSEAAAGGWGELLAINGAGSSRAGSGCPAPGSTAGARRIVLAGRRRRNNPHPAPHTCGAGTDEDGFLQLALPFCFAGHKGAGLQHSPAATLALPCPPVPALAGGSTKPTSLQSWLILERLRTQTAASSVGVKDKAFPNPLWQLSYMVIVLSAHLHWERFHREKLFCRSVQRNKS